ncbi:MAG TPA: YetF domain-containing protein [Acidimicrobiia bacterium]|nr:YetF domain-containing protein [Acidimicrobiia bacterium]
MALLTGVTVIAVLIACQFVITALSVRLPAVERFVKAEPSLLVRDSRLLLKAMRQSRVTEGEVLAAVREAGIASLADVAEAVLETDGSVTVVQASARSKDEAS